MLISSLLNLYIKKLYLLNDRFIYLVLFFCCYCCCCCCCSNSSIIFRTVCHFPLPFEWWWCVCNVRGKSLEMISSSEREKKIYSWHIKIKVFTLFSALNVPTLFTIWFYFISFQIGTKYSFIIFLSLSNTLTLSI